MSIQTHLAIGFGALLVLRALSAEGSLPSVPLGEIAREAECILIAEYIPPKTQKGTVETSPSHAFATVGQAGTLCDVANVVISVRTEEVSSQLAPGVYLVFIKRRGPKAFSYANEPFGHLRVKDGLVDTLPFFELAKEKIPLEEALVLIRAERARAK